MAGFRPSDSLVVQLALKLLGLLDFASGLHEVFVNRVVALGSNREHASLSAHITHVGSIEVLTHFGYGLKVDCATLLDIFAVNPDDV